MAALARDLRDATVRRQHVRLVVQQMLHLLGALDETWIDDPTNFPLEPEKIHPPRWPTKPGMVNSGRRPKDSGRGAAHTRRWMR